MNRPVSPTLAERQLRSVEARLKPAHTALLVIDMQNDFCAEGGYVEAVVGKDASACRAVAGPIMALVADARASGVPVELVVTGTPVPLAPGADLAAYRVVQEALTNTVKHARATRVWLSALLETGALTVVVRDDGIGGACVECGTQEATGLGGLKDRVEALGGTLDVVSPDGEGTCLTATFPLPESQGPVPGSTHPDEDVPSLA